MSLALRIAALALVALTCACAPPAEPVVARSPHPADGFEVARFLPDSTVAFLAAPSLAALVEKAEYDRARAAFAEPFERVAYEIAARTAASPLEPTWLEDAGVDLGGPAGIAFVSLRRDEELQPVVFLDLADPARFKAAAYRTLAPAGGEVHAIHDAVVIDSDGFSIVLRGHTAMIAVGHDDELARALAEQSDATSLRHHRPFRASLRAIEAATLVGYFDPRGMIYAEAGLDPRWGGADLVAARRELDARHTLALGRGRRQGVDVAELARIDRDFREAREALVAEAAEPGEGRLLRALFGTIEGAGVSLALDRRRLSLEATVLVAEDTPLRRILASGPPCAFGREGRDGLAIDGHLDPKALLEAAETAGISLGFLEPLGGAEELARALDGSFCAALVPPSELFEAREVEGALRLGLRDEIAGRRLLEALAKLSTMPEMRRVEGGYELDLGPRTIVLTVADRALVARTKAPSAKSRLALAAGAQPRALGFGMSVALPIVLGWQEPGGGFEAPTYHDPEVPKSKAYEAKRAELAEAEKALEAALGAARKASLSEAAARAAALGQVSLTVRPSPEGVHVSARWDVAGPNRVDVLARLEPEPEHDPFSDPAIDPLLERRVRVLRELDAIYDELEAAHQSQGAPREP